MTLLCLDLCSGRGGFSQAFSADPNWEVVRIDINKKFKPTIIADVRHLPLRENLSPDALLMSPPCERFSMANPRWPSKGIGEALSIVGACLDAVVWLKPKRWILENPRARLRWFLGNPPHTVRYSDYDIRYPCNKLTDFWGNIPLPMVARENKIPTGHFKSGWMRNSYAKQNCELLPRDPSQRSMIPLAVSRAVKAGVELDKMLPLQ